MKSLVLFGLAYVAVPLSSVLGIQAPVPPQPVEVIEEVQEDPPLPVAEPVVEPPKEKSIDELIDEHFGKQASNARKIMQCESGGRVDAVGDKTLQYWQDGIRYGASYGLFQIRYLPGRPTPDQLLDKEFNIRYAAEMQRNQKWVPWSCKRVL